MKIHCTVEGDLIREPRGGRAVQEGSRGRGPAGDLITTGRAQNPPCQRRTEPLPAWIRAGGSPGWPKLPRTRKLPSR